MYSVVLMMALTGGVDAVEFGHRGGGCSGGCYGGGYGGGCSGVVYGGGYGGCYGSSYGSGCYGSSYGSCQGGRGGHKHRRNRGGCGCCGGGYYSGGCYGSGYGSGYGCTGGSVIYGGGCSGGYGSGYGCTGGVIYGQPSYGQPYGQPGGYGTPVQPEQPKVMPKVEPKTGGTKKVEASAPATIVVSLPAGARLTVDGVPTRSTAAVRTLVTPALETGASYVYTLRAEVGQGNETVAQTRQVNVRAGETTQVPFTFTSTGVASR
jgi:uncharacterized protein (TIGR03000 family)